MYQNSEEKRIFIMSDPSPLTLTVPEAGKKFFSLSRNAAYAAAARGELPVVKIGRLLRVPVRACERMLEQACNSVMPRSAA
jgi:hypothetical protein